VRGHRVNQFSEGGLGDGECFRVAAALRGTVTWD